MIKNYSMKKFIAFCFLFIIFFLSSCSSKKNILYVQDILEKNNYDNILDDHVIKVDDILKISVSLENPETLQMFSSVSTTTFSENRESLVYKGYKVDNKGEINYPRLGKLKLKDLTVFEAADFIFNEITRKGILTSPSVDVKILNLSFTVLGEVKLPGKYYFDQKINFLEAIGMAGDLTINGNRKTIKIIRKYDDKLQVSTIDITSSNHIESEFFQIKSGDIIIVDPNTNRVKNAGIIGNSGTLLSLLSFLLSSLIVINN